MRSRGAEAVAAPNTLQVHRNRLVTREYRQSSINFDRAVFLFFLTISSFVINSIFETMLIFFRAKENSSRDLKRWFPLFAANFTSWSRALFFASYSTYGPFSNMGSVVGRVPFDLEDLSSNPVSVRWEMLSEMGKLKKSSVYKYQFKSNGHFHSWATYYPDYINLYGMLKCLQGPGVSSLPVSTYQLKLIVTIHSRYYWTVSELAAEICL